MATMTTYGENYLKLLLLNRWAGYLETWYVALKTWAHYNLFKWWLWIDLDLFYAKVKFGYAFVWEKVNIVNFIENYCSLWTLKLV